jgi:4-hydroxy-3-methylbut-2-enyl diphosphate reductase
MPHTRTVLITAHGISDRHRRSLLASGKQLVDTTCPLVTRAHRAGILLARRGYHVLVIGRRGHVEVNGLTEDLPSFDILESETDVRTWPHPKLGIIQQTTTPLHHAAALSDAVRRLNPHAQVRYVGTICRPTKDRQRALDELLDQVEMVVVVGGRESNNTRQLAARCEQRGVRAVHVESAADLRAAWFAGTQRVGLTAGTSTLPQTVDAVHDRLLLIARSLPPQHAGLGEVA